MYNYRNYAILTTLLFISLRAVETDQPMKHPTTEAKSLYNKDGSPLDLVEMAEQIGWKDFDSRPKEERMAYWKAEEEARTPKIENGAMFFYNTIVVKNKLDEFLKNNGGKVFVSSPAKPDPSLYTGRLSLLLAELGDLGIPWEALVKLSLNKKDFWYAAYIAATWDPLENLGDKIIKAWNLPILDRNRLSIYEIGAIIGVYLFLNIFIDIPLQILIAAEIPILSQIAALTMSTVRYALLGCYYTVNLLKTATLVAFEIIFSCISYPLHNLYTWCTAPFQEIWSLEFIPEEE